MTEVQFEDRYVLVGEIKFDKDRGWRHRLFVALRGCSTHGEADRFLKNMWVKKERKFFFERGDVIERDGKKFIFTGYGTDEPHFRELQITPMTDLEKRLRDRALKLIQEEAEGGNEYNFRGMTHTEIITYINEIKAKRRGHYRSGDGQSRYPYP